MVVETPEGPVTLPATFHFTETLTLAMGGSGAVFGYGHEVTLTDEMVEASRGRFGDSNLLSRIQAGSGIHPGSWPEDTLRFKPGSFEYHEARERARQEAHAERDPEKRTELLAKVRDDFGDVLTSRTLATIRPAGSDD